MQRDELIRSVRELLLRSGFHASMPLKLRSIAFDIVARRDRSLILVKVLTNIDAFSKENAVKLFSDLPDLFRDVQNQAAAISNFRAEVTEDTIKN